MSVAMRQVRTTQVYASEQGEEAERARAYRARGRSDAVAAPYRNDVRMKHLLEEARKELDNRHL